MESNNIKKEAEGLEQRRHVQLNVLRVQRLPRAINERRKVKAFREGARRDHLTQLRLVDSKRHLQLVVPHGIDFANLAQRPCTSANGHISASCATSKQDTEMG